MGNTKFSDKLSVLEILLLILLAICYIGTLFFLVMNHRSLSILFFVLHSCLTIVFVLIVHDKMVKLLLDQLENTPQQLEEELQMFSQYQNEISVLKEKQDSLLVEKEQLTSKSKDMEKQINELTNLLELEKHSHEQNTEVINLNHLLPETENPINLNIISSANSVIEEMLPYSRQAGIQLLLSSASDELIVRADATFIRILFRNIIDNSIKYMNRNGSLIITISNIGDDLFIVLKDNEAFLQNDDIGKIDLSSVSRLRGEDRTDFDEQMKILKENCLSGSADHLQITFSGLRHEDTARGAAILMRNRIILSQVVQ